jgi:hypothetical protein
MARLPKAASARRLCRRQTRGIINRNVPPLLIDDLNFAPSSTPSGSPPPSTTSTIIRHHSRDLILSFIMSNISSVRAILTIIIIFILMLCNMLICHASLLYMLNGGGRRESGLGPRRIIACMATGARPRPSSFHRSQALLWTFGGGKFDNSGGGK